MKTTIEFEDETIPVEVEYNYYPGDPGVWSYSNGDPGYPPTGPEIEIMSVKGDDGKDYVDLIDSKQFELLEDEILNQEPAEPDYEV